MVISNGAFCVLTKPYSTRWNLWSFIKGVIEQLREQNFAIFDYPSPCVDSFYTQSVDKNRHFRPLHLVHVVIEWPPQRRLFFRRYCTVYIILRSDHISTSNLLHEITVQSPWTLSSQTVISSNCLEIWWSPIIILSEKAALLWIKKKIFFVEIHVLDSIKFNKWFRKKKWFRWIK